MPDPNSISNTFMDRIWSSRASLSDQELTHAQEPIQWEVALSFLEILMKILKNLNHSLSFQMKSIKGGSSKETRDLDLIILFNLMSQSLHLKWTQRLQ